MSAPLTIQVRLGFSMGWRIWTPNEVRFYTKTLAHSYFVYNIIRSKLLSAKIWIVNYSILMNIAKYSIFIEYLRFGLKHKEEGLRWSKLTYLSMALSCPRGVFKKNETPQYHKKYIVKYLQAKRRIKARRQQRNRFGFRPWKGVRTGKVSRKWLKQRSTIIRDMGNYKGKTLKKTTPTIGKITFSVVRNALNKAIASKVGVVFKRPSLLHKPSLNYLNRKGRFKFLYETDHKLTKPLVGSRSLKRGREGESLLQVGPRTFQNFQPQRVHGGLSCLGVRGKGFKDLTKSGFARYRVAQRVRAIRKNTYGKYLELLENQKIFSNREMVLLQSLNTKEILKGARFLFFFYGGLYPSPFRKLRRTFSSTKVLKLKSLVWFWQKLALMVSFYTNKTIRNGFVWKMSRYEHKTLRTV